MALPYCDVPALESLAVLSLLHLLYERVATALEGNLMSRLCRLAFIGQFRCFESCERYSFAICLTKFVSLIFLWKKAFQRAAEPFCLSLVPWEVAEAFCEVEIEMVASFHDGLGLEYSLDAGSFLDEFG